MSIISGLHHPHSGYNAVINYSLIPHPIAPLDLNRATTSSFPLLWATERAVVPNYTTYIGWEGKIVMSLLVIHTQGHVHLFILPQLCSGYRPLGPIAAPRWTYAHSQRHTLGPSTSTTPHAYVLLFNPAPRHIHTNPCPPPLYLTLALWWISAPLSSSNSTVVVNPLKEANIRAVFPSYTTYIYCVVYSTSTFTHSGYHKGINILLRQMVTWYELGGTMGYE